MIRRITIEQFMSHVRTVIEPAAGLTVIVGPNNCGKSAVVNALQCLAYGAQGKPFVRHGSRSARVTVETAEGDRIEWCRERDQVSYSINGERTHRGVTPDSLPTLLRLNEVKGDDGRSEFDIHFAEQKQPIFLLGQEKQAALFFASSSDTGYLLKMQQTWKSRFGEQKKELKRINDQLVRDRAVLEAYAPVEGIEAGVRQAEVAFAELDRHETELSKLRWWIASSRTVLRTEAQQAALLEALTATQPPPALEDTDGCRRLAERWRRVAREEDRARQRVAILDLPVKPEIVETADLAELVRRMATKDRQIRKVAAKTTIVASLASPPELADTVDLTHTLRLAVQLQQRIEAAEVQVARLRTDSDEVQHELRRYLAEHPECPTCGGRIDPDRFLTQEEHAHA